MDASDSSSLTQSMEIIMRLCIVDPQESAVQSFVLNQIDDEEDTDTLYFLAKITDLKRRFNEANQECSSLDREYPSENSYLLNERLDANLVMLTKEIMDLAMQMQEKHIVVDVIEYADHL